MVGSDHSTSQSTNGKMKPNCRLRPRPIGDTQEKAESGNQRLTTALQQQTWKENRTANWSVKNRGGRKSGSH